VAAYLATALGCVRLARAAAAGAPRTAVQGSPR
jgi:hypothetical protein